MLERVPVPASLALPQEPPVRYLGKGFAGRHQFTATVCVSLAGPRAEEEEDEGEIKARSLN